MLRNNSLFLLSIFLLFMFSCKRKQAEIVIIPDALKNHLQRAHLFGKVKSVETDAFYYSDKDSLFIFSNRSIQYYSSDGYLTQALVFDDNNNLVSQRDIYYLPDAKENYWIEEHFMEQRITKDTILYDRAGFKSEEQLWVNDSLLYKIQYKTDGIGSIIEMKRLLPEYHLTNLMYYNDKGLVERIEEYDPNNKLYKFITLEYDNYGDEVNRRAFKNANDIIEYTYTQYSNEGALLKIIFEDRLHNMREDRIYSCHDATKNWLEELVLRGNDTLRKRERRIGYY